MAVDAEARARAKVDAYVRKLAAEPAWLRAIRVQSNAHRSEHGADCTVHPSSPVKGRFLQAVVQATKARRILEVGCGLGYSAIWIAEALGHGGRVETVEKDPLHVRLARRNLASAGVADRVHVLVGAAEDLLPSLSGPYDLVFEDAAYGGTPAYHEAMVRIVRVGGMLITSNWFPVESALRGEKGPFATAGRGAQRYARRLFRDPRFVGCLVPGVWWGVSTKVRA